MIAYWDAAMITAANYGELDALKEALSNGADAKTRDSYALQLAAGNGHHECVRLLIPLSDPMAEMSKALREASYHGFEECVAALLPVSDAMAVDSWALRQAARWGHEAIVRLLLPASDLTAESHEAVRSAVKHGRLRCLELMLPAVSDAVLANMSQWLESGMGFNISKAEQDQELAMLKAEMEARAISDSMRASSLSTGAKLSL